MHLKTQINFISELLRKKKLIKNSQNYKKSPNFVHDYPKSSIHAKINSQRIHKKSKHFSTVSAAYIQKKTYFKLWLALANIKKLKKNQPHTIIISKINSLCRKMLTLDRYELIQLTNVFFWTRSCSSEIRKECFIRKNVNGNCEVVYDKPTYG